MLLPSLLRNMCPQRIEARVSFMNGMTGKPGIPNRLELISSKRHRNEARDLNRRLARRWCRPNAPPPRRAESFGRNERAEAPSTLSTLSTGRTASIYPLCDSERVTPSDCKRSTEQREIGVKSVTCGSSDAGWCLYGNCLNRIGSVGRSDRIEGLMKIGWRFASSDRNCRTNWTREERP